MHFLNCLIEGFSLTLNSVISIWVLSVKCVLVYGWGFLFCFVCSLWFLIKGHFFFLFFRAQLLDYKMALNLTKYLKMEEEFLPWQRVISAVTYIISMFEDDTELYPVIEVMLMIYLMQVNVQHEQNREVSEGRSFWKTQKHIRRPSEIKGKYNDMTSQTKEMLSLFFFNLRCISVFGLAYHLMYFSVRIQELIF